MLLENQSDFKQIHLSDLSLERQQAIYNTHYSYDLLNDIDNLDITYVGGYPLALLLGNLEQDHISPRCYTDIDIIAKDSIEDTYSQYSSIVPPNSLTHDSNRASTNKILYEDGPLVLQFIKLYTSGESALKGFDLINSQVEYDPATHTFLYHQDLFELMNDRKIKFSEWLFADRIEDSHIPFERYEDYLFITFNRIVKYGLRWQLGVGDQEFDWMMRIFPQIRTMFDSPPQGNGSSGEQRYSRNLFNNFRQWLNAHCTQEQRNQYTRRQNETT